ncbi:MAG: InlB B-repeat-containing protein [Oscillospiraceae bacterium]|nr:InlB B-repeat-containing protein [Oscillospiraceae bacterium]
MIKNKQWIALLLCLLMAMSLLPVSAAAEGGDDAGLIDIEPIDGEDDSPWIGEDEIGGDLITVIGGDEVEVPVETAPRPAGAHPYGRLVLDVDWSLIEQVEHQHGGQACACFSLAYCRTILDGVPHQFSEYNSGTSELDAWCQWSWGNYVSNNYLDTDESYENIYKELCGGNPVVALVWGTRTQHHYVAIVGFENVVSGQSLSAYNFLIIDPCAPRYMLENMGGVGYDLKPLDNDTYQVVCDNTTTAASFEANVSSYLSRCTVYPCYRSLTAAKTTSIRSLPCAQKTDADSTLRTRIAAGESFTATALVQNPAGAYWYRGKTVDGVTGYAFAGYFGAGTSLFSDMQVTDLELPYQQDPGYPFYIQGKVIAGFNTMTSLSAAVYTGADTEANPRMIGTVTLGQKVYTLGKSSVADALQFQNLGTGAYTYEVTATCRNYYSTDGKTLKWTDPVVTLVSQGFTVGTVNSFSVRYDANGGSGAPAGQTKQRGQSLTLSGQIPVRENYRFLGWATKRGATAAQYQAGGSYTVEAPAVLYAVWKLAVEKPAVSSQPKSAEVIVGRTVRFTVKASDVESYQWYYRKSSTDSWKKCSSSDSTEPTLHVEALGYRSGYQYRCKMSNLAGTTYSNAVKLTVITKPTVTTQPMSVTVKAGTTVKLTVKATGAASYQWYYRKSSTDSWKKCTLPGSTTATLQVAAYSYRSGYRYYCRVTNAAGSVCTKAAVLTVTK